MSTVDISRFAHGLPTLFAPAVREGQTFYAFLEKENSLTVQADNVLKEAVIHVVQQTNTQETAASIQSESSAQKGIYAYIHLDNGTDEQGNIKTVVISLGPLNPNAIDDSKLVDVVEALGPLLDKTILVLMLVDKNGAERMVSSY